MSDQEFKSHDEIYELKVKTCTDWLVSQAGGNRAMVEFMIKKVPWLIHLTVADGPRSANGVNGHDCASALMWFDSFLRSEVEKQQSMAAA